MVGKTLVENLNKSSILPEKLFSFKFSTTPGESELIIGGANIAAFESDTLVSVPVTEHRGLQGFWQIDLGGISRPNHTVPESVNVPAIVDTGNTVIFVPQAIADSYYAGIFGAICLIDTGKCTGASYLYITAGSLHSTSCSSMR